MAHMLTEPPRPVNGDERPIMIYCSHMNDERQKSQLKQQRHRYMPTPTLRSEAVGEVSGIKIPTPLKVVVAVALLFGALFAVYRKVSVNPPTAKPPVASADSSDAGRKIPSNTVARAESVHATGTESPVIQTSNETEVSLQDVTESAVTVPTAVDVPTTTEKPQPVRKHVPRVVFTDGKRIVRRPGGVVEVPRVFSCAGAGIKPFWVYDARPEVEAAKEKKAREEWEFLVRQAEKGSR